MELSKRDDLTQKLILTLKKTAEYKKFDSIFAEKFLVSFTKEFSNLYENIIHAPEFSGWLSETIQKWKQTNPNVAEAVFICKFIGLLTKNKEGLQVLINSHALTELVNILQSNAFEHRTLTPVYISFLSDILTHTIGYEWVKITKQWKIVSKLYFFNSNLYVEREGLNFLKIFISKIILDGDGSKEILQEIFPLLNTYNKINIEDQKCISVIILYLNLIQLLLEAQMFFENSSFLTKLGEIFDLQTFLNFLFKNSKENTVLEKASVVQIIFFVFQCKDKRVLKNISTVIDCYFILLKKNQLHGITKLAKYCQVLWNEVRKKMKCESETGVQYIIVQLLPALVCAKPDTGSCYVYIQKLFSLTNPEAQKFFYLLNDKIKSKMNSDPKNLAMKSILSLVSNTECLNSDEVLIIFKALACVLNSFALDKSSSSELITFNEFEKEISLKVQDTAILSAVLNALCVLFEKFKVKWCQALESMCLFKISCSLLENPNLSPVVFAQVFSLVKLAILNFTSPDLPLLPNNSKNSNFDCLFSLLLKRLHDPNWEIRDSCLEVVTAIAEMSESQCLAFEQLLVEKNFCLLLLDIMEGDSESYVRASAIQALTAMIKIESLSQLLISKDVCHKIIKLLQNESEAIVRREAALMIKQLYLSVVELHDEIITSFYEVMGYSAVCDLHWEVKVNSLIFWEAVVQRISANHGISNYIPNVTFLKEENEVKSRMQKILNKLSEIGCLYVLLSTLNDDCDMPVIRKSAEILSKLMSVLEHYGIREFFNDISVGERLPMKRKSTFLDSFEKKKTSSFIASNNSDGSGEITSGSFQNEKSASSDLVIDEIVNEKDINLIGVCFQKDQTINFQTKILLQRLPPETFLSQMQNFNFEKFLEEKQKWLVNVEVDLKSLLLETCAMDLTDETNLMDCY